MFKENQIQLNMAGLLPFPVNKHNNLSVLPSKGTTEGSLIEGDIALLSTATTSASRPRALTGGVEDNLGRFTRLDRPEEEGSDEEASRLRSEGVDDGFRSTAGAFDSPPWLFDPSAMKSPGGGCPGRVTTSLIVIHYRK